MSEIAYGGIAGLLGGLSYEGSYYLTPEGYLANADGSPASSTVFNQEIVTLHRTLDLPIVPGDWTSWAPDPFNNEWDSYSASAANVGTATMVDGSGIDIPSTNPLEIGQDAYNTDTVAYQFDPTSAAWQNLAMGETLTVTFVVSASERNTLTGTVNDTDTFTVTLHFTKVCFARGTLIETADGPVAIEDIKAGTMVRTLDAGLQPVRWIGSSVVGGDMRQIPQNLRPIRISAGALGGGYPTKDLLVSPQHRVLVRSRIAQRMFGAEEILIAAKQLLSIDGIEVDTSVQRVEYFHMMFDEHQIVISNGALTESLYLGTEALNGLGSAAVNEILAILPQLRAIISGEGKPGSARLLVSGKRARKLVGRHARNDKPLAH